MDSASFPRPLISNVITHNLHRSCTTPHSARFGLWKNNVTNLALYAVGFSKVGVEDMFDDSDLKRNENGAILGTFDSEITQENNDFFVSEAEGDPDCPSKGYSSIEHALNALREGKVSCNFVIDTTLIRQHIYLDIEQCFKFFLFSVCSSC